MLRVAQQYCHNAHTCTRCEPEKNEQWESCQKGAPKGLIQVRSSTYYGSTKKKIQMSPGGNEVEQSSSRPGSQ